MVHRRRPHFFGQRKQADDESAAAHEQNSGYEDESDAETEPTEGFEGKRVGAGEQPFLVAERRHHLRSSLAQETAYRNEFVTFGMQAVNNLRQSCNGVAAIAGTIVHQ